MKPLPVISPYGANAWLVESTEYRPVDLAAAIRKSAKQAESRHKFGKPILEVIPGAQTVLVIGNPELPQRTALPALTELLETINPSKLDPETHPLVTLNVHYDGDDLAALSALLDLSADHLIELHSEPEYEVAFCGFAPGFAYLTGLNPVLQIPRKATPRAQVPAGSVAIADTYSAVYPQASPGGWHLLGHTDTKLFDLNLRPPALLTPGTRVRFNPVTPVTSISQPDSVTQSDSVAPRNPIAQDDLIRGAHTANQSANSENSSTKKNLSP